MATMEERIQNAVTQHKGYVLDNLSTLTMKRFRELLEEDLELPPKTLKDYRELVDGLVDEIVVEHARAKKKKAKAEPLEAAEDLQASAEKGVLKPHNRNKKEPKKQATSSKKGKESAKKKTSAEKRGRNEDSSEKAKKRQKASEKKTAATKPGKSYSKSILKLKDVCKRAAITIPTVIYKKNKTEAEIADALSDLLDRHGLSKDSGRGEVAAARAKIQKDKDLEGIDMSNIVTGGRRASRATINYAQSSKGPDLDMSDSEEEEETPELDDDESDENGDSDEDMGEPEPRRHAKGKSKAVEDEEEQEEGMSEEQPDEEKTDNTSEVANEDSEDLHEEEAQKSKAAVQKSTPVKTPNSGVRITARRSEGKKVIPQESEEEESDESEEETAIPRRKITDWSDSE